MAHFRDLGGQTNGDRDTAVVATDAQRATWRDVFSQPLGGGPTTRGFDIYFGTDVPNWPPYCFIENDRTVGIPSELLPAELLTDNLASLPGPALRDWQLPAILPALADRACAFITESASNPAPFLLYLPLTSPHTPLAVNDAWKGRSGLESSVADLVIETDAVVQRSARGFGAGRCGRGHAGHFHERQRFCAVLGCRTPESPRAFSQRATARLQGGRLGRRSPRTVPRAVARRDETRWSVWPAYSSGRSVSDDSRDPRHDPPRQRGRGQREPAAFVSRCRPAGAPHAISQGSDGLLTLRDGAWKLIVGPGGGGGWSSLSAEPRATTPGQLYDLDADLGEQHNVCAEQPERVAAMLGLLDKLVTDGRSTPGVPQANDVPVRWRRFMDQAAPPGAGNR